MLNYTIAFSFLHNIIGEMQQDKKYETNCNGFTLVDLVIFIAMIGILVGLLLPNLWAAREAARRRSFSKNIRQLGLALHDYEPAHRKLPPSRIAVTHPFSCGSLGLLLAGNPSLTNIDHCLPVFDFHNFHDSTDFDFHDAIAP